MPTFNPRWTVAIFSSRESFDTLITSVKAVVAACGDVPAVVDILVNGNQTLAETIQRWLTSIPAVKPNCAVRLWFISMGDKAHTWNQFVHHINSGQSLVFFIDGYVAVCPNAFQLIDEGLIGDPIAIAATGLPSTGRSAATLRRGMLQYGGLHGNLFAVGSSVLSTLVERGFRMPLGLYRNDSLLATIFNYNLSPTEYSVDTKRVRIEQQSTWAVVSDNSSLFKKILTQLKRKVRQGQGHLENCAFQAHFTLKKLRPELLPATSSEMVISWVRDNPIKFRRLWLRNFFIFFAFRKISQPRNWSLTKEIPSLMFNSQDNGVISQTRNNDKNCENKK